MAAPQALTLDDCLHVARRHFGRQDVQVSHWKERSLAGAKPAGYLGGHKTAEVYASSEGREECIIPVFIKMFPDNETQANVVEETGAFRKEVLYYSTLASDWERRGIAPNESVADRLSGGDNKAASWSCRCYIARHDMIVLENVASYGYKSDESRNTYDYEHALLAIKMVAQLHAASLIYEEERSTELKKPYRIGEDFPEIQVDTLYPAKKGCAGEMMMEAGVVALTECAKLLPLCQVDANARRRVQSFLPGVLRRMCDCVKASPRFRNVLCHADLWQNNLLFRYDADGRPADVVLVDFQLLRYVPPAHDIFDLLHLTTRRSMRECHEEKLLDEYYAALGEALQRRGLHVERVLPRGDFNASLDEQRLAGRLSACFMLHFAYSSDKMLAPVFRDADAYNFTVNGGEGRARLVCAQFKEDEVYRERIEECLMEVVDNYVLGQ